MNFNPTRDWVVLPIPHKKVTDSGILLSDEAANSLKSNILEALKVGPECKLVKQGDMVYVHPHTEGIIITVEGLHCYCRLLARPWKNGDGGDDKETGFPLKVSKSILTLPSLPKYQH